MSLVPKEVRVGFLKSMTPSAHDADFGKAVFVLADGTELPVHGSYRKVFRDVRAYADPERKAVLFLRFGGLGRVEGDAGALGDRIAGVGRSNLIGRQPELSGDFRDSVVGDRRGRRSGTWAKVGHDPVCGFTAIAVVGAVLRIMHSSHLIRRKS